MLQKLLVFVFFLPMVFHTEAQGIEFEHGTWAEALAKAQKEDKMIFVDGYAVWCGPCKMLAKNIFPQESVGKFFNENFVNVKMDMEKGEGPTFRRKYPVSAFPTLLFIAPDGELVQSNRGAPRTAEALINIAVNATKKFDRSADYMKKYEGGDRSYETMYNLVKSLNKSGKSSLKYANEYLRAQEDMSSKENLMFLFEALTQVDSRVYDEFVKYKNSFSDYYAQEFVDKRVQDAANKTVENAIEFKTPELLKEAQTKYAKLYPQQESQFNANSNLTYAAATKDADLFLKSVKEGAFDVERQKEIINIGLTEFEDDDKVMKMTEKWAKDVADVEDSAGSYYLLAMTQIKQARVNQAIKSLEKCIEKTDPEAKELKLYVEQLQKLKAQ